MATQPVPSTGASHPSPTGALSRPAPPHPHPLPQAMRGGISIRRAPARVQWDAERDLRLQPLPHRSLQLGLAGEAARLYADEWITSITDITPLAHTIHAHIQVGDLDAARQLLPRERPYPVKHGILAHLSQ